MNELDRKAMEALIKRLEMAANKTEQEIEKLQKTLDYYNARIIQYKEKLAENENN